MQVPLFLRTLGHDLPFKTFKKRNYKKSNWWQSEDERHHVITSCKVVAPARNLAPSEDHHVTTLLEDSSKTLVNVDPSSIPSTPTKVKNVLPSLDIKNHSSQMASSNPTKMCAIFKELPLENLQTYSKCANLRKIKGKLIENEEPVTPTHELRPSSQDNIEEWIQATNKKFKKNCNLSFEYMARLLKGKGSPNYDTLNALFFKKPVISL